METSQIERCSVQSTTWCINRVQYWWKRLQESYVEQFPCPRIEFSLRMSRTAGLATTNFRNPSQSFITLALCHMHEADFDNTIAHECVHIYCNLFYRSHCGHDWRWRSMMQSLGLQPNRCHTYEVVVNKQERTPVSCPTCGYTYKFSQNRLTRARKGTSRYCCTRCRTPLKV